MVVGAERMRWPTRKECKGSKGTKIDSYLVYFPKDGLSHWVFS
jgi:hypothetical protein